MKKLIVALLLMCMCIRPVQVSAESGPVSSVNQRKAILSTIDSYYNLMYDSYLDLELASFDNILDLSRPQNKNKVSAMENIIKTWDYALILSETKDSRTRLNYSYEVISLTETKDSASVTIEVSGDITEAYPPFISFGENTFVFSLQNGLWKIVEHIYDGIDFFEGTKDTVIERGWVDTKILVEKSQVSNSDLTKNSEVISTRAGTYTNYPYSTIRAITYANNFVSSGNPAFYSISKDCTNFISQCISYGFGTTSSYAISNTSYKMLANVWHAGSGGGSSSWENVNSNWTYMISSKGSNDGPRAGAQSSAATGEVVQFWWSDKLNGYNHSAIIVGTQDGVYRVAQHSNNGYRLLPDLIALSQGVRYYLPSAFREYD